MQFQQVRDREAQQMGCCHVMSLSSQSKSDKLEGGYRSQVKAPQTVFSLLAGDDVLWVHTYGKWRNNSDSAVARLGRWEVFRKAMSRKPRATSCLLRSLSLWFWSHAPFDILISTPCWSQHNEPKYNLTDQFVGRWPPPAAGRPNGPNLQDRQLFTEIYTSSNFTPLPHSLPSLKPLFTL